ncbi:MAG: FAD-dependent oxidoreductase, partial [Candidatus Diapherotrites archaeon]|nr:FAD-dependent oxidoreductase [Candidatus Diapherotrites archaeon]
MFCPCPNGLVATEAYDGFVCVNGHSNSTHLSENSNFAFVSKVKLTEPVENTTAYARSIAQLATTIGGGKPIIQRLKDFKKHRRSNWERINKCFTKPSLTDVTPGDIAMALPARVVQNIKEGLEALE